MYMSCFSGLTVITIVQEETTVFFVSHEGVRVRLKSRRPTDGAPKIKHGQVLSTTGTTRFPTGRNMACIFTISFFAARAYVRTSRNVLSRDSILNPTHEFGVVNI